MSLFKWYKQKKREEAQPSSPSAYPPQPLNPAKAIKSVIPHGKVVTPHSTHVLGPQSSGSTDMLHGGQKVAFLPTSISMPSDEPADMPIEDKDIYLEIGDIVERIPPGLLGNVTPHLKRHISFRLREIFPDLAKGRATVPLSVLYSFCPEIFAQPVAPDDPTPISLPLQKLVEQVGTFTQRADQVQPEEVAHFDTPISKVAAEDAGRFRRTNLPDSIKPTPTVPQTPALAPKAGEQHQSTDSPTPPSPTHQPPPPPPPPRPPQTVTPVISDPIPLPRPSASPLPLAPTSPAPPPSPLPSIRFEQSHNVAQSPLTAPLPTTELPKRPPATVRASFTGGKITLRASPTASEENPSLPPSQSQSLPLISPPRPEPLLRPNPTGSAQKTRSTARIQLPSLRLLNTASSPTANTNNPDSEGAKLAPVAPKPLPFSISAPQPVLKPGLEPTLPPVPPVETAQISFTPPPASKSEPSPQLSAPAPKAPAPLIPLLPSQPTPPEGGASTSSIATTQSPVVSGAVALAPKAPPPESPSQATPVQVSPTPVAPPPVALASKVAPPPHPSAPTVPSSKSPNALVSISLAKIVKALPPDLSVLFPDSIPNDICIQLETSFVENQLARGSVKLSKSEFINVLPQEFRQAISNIPNDASIALPLAEVFAALPQGALQMRRDQVSEQLTEVFDTPFSRKAEEDALLHKTSPGTQPAKSHFSSPFSSPSSEAQPYPVPAAEPKISSIAPVSQVQNVPTPKAEVMEDLNLEKGSEVSEKNSSLPVPLTEAPPAENPPAPVSFKVQSTPVDQPKSSPTPAASQPARQQAITPLVPARSAKRADPITQPEHTGAHDDQTELQALFMTEDHLDAKGIVRHISRLPGIASCHLMFSDGLPIAGNLPEGLNAEAFSALCPQFWSRIEQTAKDLTLGEVSSVTLYTNQSPVSFMASQGVGLVIIHSRDRYLPGVREKLMAIMKEIGRLYTPDKAH